MNSDLIMFRLHTRIQILRSVLCLLFVLAHQVLHEPTGEHLEMQILRRT